MTSEISSKRVNELKPIENFAEGEQALRSLLDSSKPAKKDFRLISMFCGSGRTPGDGTESSQHWNMKPFNDNELTFRYKDTLVTYNPTTQNVECITYGPGQGRRWLPVAYGAAVGSNPSIEEMQAQQSEILQMIGKIRNEMRETNPAIKVLPEATIIGFSRGAAAVQQASRKFIPPSLPLVDAVASTDCSKLKDRIEITQDVEEGKLRYKVFLENQETSHGEISESEMTTDECPINLRVPLSQQEVSHAKIFEKQVNRVLLNKGEAGAGERTLLDIENSLWISLDAVAGRWDKGEDHLVNPECHGVYVMSTKIEPGFAMVKGFGATNPKIIVGEEYRWEHLAMNGGHGVVFDDKELRQCIVDNAAQEGPIGGRKEAIIRAIRPANTHAMLQSIIPSSEVYEQINRENCGEQMQYWMRNGPLRFKELINQKINEIKNPGLGYGIDGLFIWGRGEVREQERLRQLQNLSQELDTFLKNENDKRETNDFPSLEEVEIIRRIIFTELQRLDDFITARGNCKEEDAPIAFAQKDIAVKLAQNLYDEARSITPDLTREELAQCLEAMSKQIEDVINEKRNLLEGAQSTRTVNKPGYTPLGTFLGIYGTTEVSSEPGFDAKELTGKLEHMRVSLSEMALSSSKNIEELCDEFALLEPKPEALDESGLVEANQDTAAVSCSTGSMLSRMNQEDVPDEIKPTPNDLNSSVAVSSGSDKILTPLRVSPEPSIESEQIMEQRDSPTSRNQ
ncbi:Uncharacterised protein [Legionella sainthelensi]|uniref:hypothetical protein n=1 Tax=Legionella sainthelensi TaxID=28087 RepID=UPI000F712741|nr:hypothetical protein [Legionella sainthelensi]VEB35538.1 Uncharacterised protein [Legionella sainthelensi]